MTERSGWVKSLRYNRCMVLWGILMLLFPLATALTAQTSAPWVVPEAARKVKNPVKSTPESLAAAAKLFRVNCMICHGKTGAGNGPTAKTLTIKPANFTDAKMMSQMTDGELFWKMSKGRGAMPTWEDQLSETERWELVNYIRTFAHKKAE